MSVLRAAWWSGCNKKNRWRRLQTWKFWNTEHFFVGDLKIIFDDSDDSDDWDDSTQFFMVVGPKTCVMIPGERFCAPPFRFKSVKRPPFFPLENPEKTLASFGRSKVSKSHSRQSFAMTWPTVRASRLQSLEVGWDAFVGGADFELKKKTKCVEPKVCFWNPPNPTWRPSFSKNACFFSKIPSSQCLMYVITNWNSSWVTLIKIDQDENLHLNNNLHYHQSSPQKKSWAPPNAGRHPKRCWPQPGLKTLSNWILTSSLFSSNQRRVAWIDIIDT